MKSSYRYAGALVMSVAALILWNGCDEKSVDDPPEENPGELITKIILRLVDNATSDTVVAVWSDPSGGASGGVDPVVDTLRLETGHAYSGTIEILDETKNPPESITEEVEEESEVHQFFYTTSGDIAGRVAFIKTDQDMNGLPIGLVYSVTVSQGGAAQGSLNVVLSHYDPPPKTAEPSGESDVDIDFRVEVL